MGGSGIQCGCFWAAMGGWCACSTPWLLAPSKNKFHLTWTLYLSLKPWVLLLVQSASASLASRFVLVGVMDGGPSQGVALISVDGKPAKPYRLGQTVSEGFVVVGTGPKKAELGPQYGGLRPALVLELPLKK